MQANMPGQQDDCNGWSPQGEPQSHHQPKDTIAMAYVEVAEASSSGGQSRVVVVLRRGP